MSMALVCVMLSGMLPVMQTTVNAATISESEIRARIDTLASTLVGTYFNVGHTSADCNGGAWESGHGCSNCDVGNVIQTAWLKNLIGVVPSSTSQLPNADLGRGGQSCYGFANFAEWYIFRESNSSTVDVSAVASCNFNYSDMSKYARVGDIIRIHQGSLSAGHSLIFISADSSGIYALDCNGAKGEPNCAVKRWTFYYSSVYPYAKVYRANNSNFVGKTSTIESRPFVGYGYTTQGSAVSDLQSMLNRVNGAGLDVDGIFGAGTYQAVRNYQSLKGLTADGICGDATWTALEADYNAANVSNSSSTPKATAPFAPTNVKVTKIDNRNAQISWNSVSGATSYEVQFRRDGIDWRADTDYAGGTSYTSTYLDYDPYYFRVRALNSAGTSAWVEITYYRNGIAARPIVGRGYTTQGTAVSDLQTMLNKVIGVGLSVDGIFGDSTYNAVSTYQSRKGLTADGICGADTWAALEADYNAAATANVHSHSLAHVPAKAATEQAEGNIEYWYCSGCGKYFSNASATQEISKVQTVLAKLTHKHSLTHTAAKASTEKSVGNIEYWRCAGCGKYFSDANATKEISREQTVVTQLNHTHKLVHTAKKDATCTDGGNMEFWRCSDCLKYFSDAQGKNEIVSQSILTAALGHNYVNGVCARCGEKQNNVAKGQFGDVSLAKQTLYFQGQFADVPADQWFTSGVASAFEFGLMKGNGDGFNPYGDVTLAEAITMAARINSIYTTGGESFDQSVGNAWYQTYLDYTYQNGIISRAYYNSNVNNKATRAQFAEIFAKCLPDAALPEGNIIPDDAIPDVGMSDSFAQHVYKLYRAGILTGSDANGTFSPLTYITRAEAATIVSRMADSRNRVEISLR